MSISIISGSIVVDDFGSIRVTEQGLISAFDLIRVVAGQKNPYQVWIRLSEVYPDVLTICENFKFPGRGQKETPVVNKKTALKILGVLPGAAGASYREAAATTLLTYLENPDQLAKAAIARIDDLDQLKEVDLAVRQRYIEKGYRPAMEEIKNRANNEQWAYIAVNKATTKAITGHTPKEVQTLRYTGTAKNPPSARKLMSEKELGFAERCHEVQAISLKSKEIQGAKEVVKECEFVADEFADFLKRIGLHK